MSSNDKPRASTVCTSAFDDFLLSAPTKDEGRFLVLRFGADDWCRFAVGKWAAETLGEEACFIDGVELRCGKYGWGGVAVAALDMMRIMGVVGKGGEEVRWRENG